MAYNIIDLSKSSNSAANPTTSGCAGVVLFLTDGEDSTFQPDEIIARNESQYRIFSYIFGSGADITMTQQIACKTKGV